MGLHDCGFSVAAASVPEPISVSTGVVGIGRGDTKADSIRGPNVLLLSPVRPVFKPSAVGGLAGLDERKVLLRVERWFFTSDFLMRLIIAPVLLLTWKVLVRSEA